MVKLVDDIKIYLYLNYFWNFLWIEINLNLFHKWSQWFPCIASGIDFVASVILLHVGNDPIIVFLHELFTYAFCMFCFSVKDLVS